MTSTQKRIRTVNVHKVFLQSCDLVKLTFEGDRFAESTNGQMNIHLPSQSFDEIDRFLKFCYDGTLDVDDAWSLIPKEDCLVPLYKLADYMQCNILSETILDYWRNGLNNGLAFANIISFALEAGENECVKAAIANLPLKKNKEKETDSKYC